MKSRKGLAILMTLVFLMTVFIPGTSVFAGTSIHLKADADRAWVYLEDANGDPETGWAANEDPPGSGIYEMDPGAGGFTMTDNGSNHLPMVIWFKLRIDGVDTTYIVNPEADRSEEVRVGEEGQLGAGTNNYWIGDPSGYALEIKKEAEFDSYYPGDIINYTITVTNIGTEAVETIDVTDLTFSTTLTSIPSLAVGASAVRTFSYTVPIDYAEDTLTNTAQITAFRDHNNDKFDYDITESDSETVNILERPTYNVTYDANGGTGAPTDTNDYYENDTVTVKSDAGMTKTNYHFVGWTTPDNSGLGDFAGTGSETFSMPAEDVRLVAQWEMDPQYNVTYDANGGTGAPTDTNDYFEGDTVTVKSDAGMTRANHSFNGWTTPTNTTVGDFSGTGSETFSMPAEDVNLVAQWIEDEKFDVTYYGNGADSGSQTDSSSPYYAGTTVTILDEGSLVKANYTFIGWAMSSGGAVVYLGTGSETMVMPAADVDLYAQWSENPQYTVTYHGNGADSGSQTDSSSPYYAGETVTVLDEGSFVKANYTFAGWAMTSGGAVVYAGTGTETFDMPANNVHLYAKWTEDGKYNVTYFGNGADSGSQTDVNSPYYAEETVTVLDEGTFVKANHTFAGWAMSSGGAVVYAGTGTETFTMPAEHVNLYAKWTEDAKYTVTYHGNGADSGSQTDSSSPYYAGSTVTVLDEGTFVKANYTFAGWAMSSGGAVVYTGSGTETFDMPASNVDLYAKWTEDAKYTVTYHGNGADSGSQTDSSSPYYAGSTVTVLDEGTFVKANYTFAGWAMSSGGAVVYTGSGTETFDMPASNVDLYAKWTEDAKYTVTYHGNGADSGSQTDSSSPYYAGSTVTVLDEGTFVKANHTFAGWAMSSGGAVVYTGSGTETFDMPASNVDLYAKWTEDGKYTVTYFGNGADSGSQTDSSSPYYAGASVTVLDEGTFVKANHTFEGWAMSSGGAVVYTGSGTETFTMPEANVNLYAQWSLVETSGLTITKTVNGQSSVSVTAGASVDFRIVVTNPGNSPIWEVRVVDTMLGVDEYRDTLGAGQQIIIEESYTTTVQDIPGFTNTAVATALSHREELLEEEASATVNVSTVPTPPPTPTPPPPTPTPLPDPDIEVTITPDATLVEVGTDVEFTIVVTNNGRAVLRNVRIVNAELGIDENIGTLFVDSDGVTRKVTKNMDVVGDFDTTVTATGEASNATVSSVSDTDLTAVEVYEIVIPPPPEPPPENPPTGAIPFDVYSVSGLLAMGAGIFALIKRKKEDDEDED